MKVLRPAQPFRSRSAVVSALMPAVFAMSTFSALAPAALAKGALAKGAFAKTNAAPSASPSAAQPKNDSLLKAQRGELTISDVLDGIGSPQSATRREMALTVLALRDHYVAGARTVVEKRYQGKAGALSAANALETLAWLRVTDPDILRGAARHIGFNWTPPVLHDMFSLHQRRLSRPRLACALSLPPRATYPAARLLMRAGFAALPILAEEIAVAPLPVEGQTPRDKTIALACARLILGPATTTWLQEQAQATTDAARRDKLQAAARFVAAQPPALGSEEAANTPPAWLRGLDLESDSDDGFFHGELALAPLKAYRIRWDAALALGDEKTQIKDRAMPQMDNPPLAATSVARNEIVRATRLLAINIIERLPSYSQHSSNDPTPFAPEAQIDAVRLIGALRLMPQTASYSLWDLLFKQSLSGAVDKNGSEDVAVILRALGQIGTPAATLLLGRMVHVSGSNSHRASIYALATVMGHYSRDYLNNEIAASKRKREAKGKPFNRDSYEAEYMDALQLGEENKWFEGALFGSSDPQAFQMLPPKQPS